MLEVTDTLIFKPHFAVGASSFERFKVVFSFTRKDDLSEKEIMRILASFKKQLKRTAKKTEFDAFVILHKILTSLAEEHMLKLFTERMGSNVVIVLSDYDVNPRKKPDNIRALMAHAEAHTSEIGFLYKNLENKGTYHTALVQEVFDDYFLGYHYHKSGSRYRHYSFENMFCVNVYQSKRGFASFEASFTALNNKVIYSLREESAIYESK